MWTDGRTHVRTYAYTLYTYGRTFETGFIKSILSKSRPKKTCPNFTKFSVRVTYGRGSVLLWWKCDILCTSGFVDDVMFHITDRTGPNQRQRVCCVQLPGTGTCRTSDNVVLLWSPGGGIGAKSAISDCILSALKYKFNCISAMNCYFHVRYKNGKLWHTNTKQSDEIFVGPTSGSAALSRLHRTCDFLTTMSSRSPAPACAFWRTSTWQCRLSRKVANMDTQQISSAAYRYCQKSPCPTCSGFRTGLWHRHRRQMPTAYDVEGAYERRLQNILTIR